MKELFQSLTTKAKTVPGIKDVQLYNSQLLHLKTDTLAYPAVLVELKRVDYDTEPNNNQIGNLNITLHIVNESPSQGEEFDIYDLKELVNRYFYRFSEAFYSPLVRVNEQLDTNHSNLYDFQITYATRFQEYIEPLDEIQININEINLQTDLDIDNAEIRSGDNLGYDFMSTDTITAE